jgi:hypothetical protein
VQRQVHREAGPEINVTVWWGAEDQQLTPLNLTCSDGSSQCARVSVHAEAVFPVFVYERLGSVSELIAQIGGALSLIMSSFYTIAFICKRLAEIASPAKLTLASDRILNYCLCDKQRLIYVLKSNTPEHPIENKLVLVRGGKDDTTLGIVSL